MNIIDMECIAEIQSEILFASEKAKEDRYALKEVNMDKFLDAILTLQKIIATQSEMSDKLADMLRTQVYRIDKDDFSSFEPLLKKLIRIYENLYIKIRNNTSIYSGVKTNMISFRNSVDNLKEVFNDINVSIQLNEDQEYLSLVNRINSF